MKFEAVEKELIYIRVDPDNEKQIEEASLQEREGFGTGLDPQELPSVLRYIARHGNIWLQHVLENGHKNPTGVIEFILLEKALKFDPFDPSVIAEDLSGSPFVIAMANQERVFQDARRFAEDKNIIYHHGIAMSRRGKGYGTQLLKYALTQNPKGVIVCYIDGAKLNGDSGELEIAPNEDSYTVHLKAGFVLAGVVEPPVYDEELTYYCFLRPEKPLRFISGYELKVNLANENAEGVIARVKELTSAGHFGVEYDKNTHLMFFKKLKD